MKKSLKPILSVLIVLVLLCGIGGFCLHTLHQQETAREIVDIQLEIPQTPAEALQPGEAVSLGYTVTNNGYLAAELREVLVLTLFDAQGAPVNFGTMAQKQSVVDLFYPEQLAANDGLSGLPKAVQANQAVYAAESFPIAGAERKFGFLFPGEEATAPEGVSNYYESTLQILLDPSAEAADYAVCVDVIIQSNENGHWTDLVSAQLIFADTNHPIHTMDLPGSVPELTNTLGFAWEITDDTALLTGIGTVQDENIVIPAQISLSAITNGEEQIVVEDPVHGVVYPVVVAGSAFRNCDTLRTVTFLDGSAVQDNAMCTPGQGMFSGCDQLEMVYNIPDTVTNMAYAFSKCPALKETPMIPDGVTNLSFCFNGCTALTTVQELGSSIENMQSTFSDCTALETAPAIPNSVIDLDETFRNCTALTSAPTLGSGVESMCYTFSGCTALAETPVLPAGVRNLDYCFRGCTALTETPVLPDTVESLNVFILGCSNISGSLTIPFGAIEYNESFIPRLAFADCDSLNEILLDCCDHVYDSDELPDDIRVVFLQEHVYEGICPWCHIVNTTIEIDGLTVVFEGAQVELYEHMVTFIDDVVPDYLMECCARLTITNTLGKYYYDPDNVNGVAFYPSCYAYVKVPPYVNLVSLEWTEDTTIHELAHCYDHNFSSYARFSQSPQWINMPTAEYLWIAEEYGSTYYYKNDILGQRKDSFAEAVEEYYSEPKRLAQMCPEMYAYLLTIIPE